MILSRLTGVLIVILLIAGCSGAKNEANNENFTEVINEYLREKVILVATDPEFPVTIETSESGKAFNRNKLKKFDALVAAKLLTVENVYIERLKFGSPVGEIIKIPARKYEMTQMGKENFYKKVKNGMVEESGFKLGYYQVDRISSFTKPVERMYYIVTQVYYECSPKELREWAIDSRIIDTLPFLKDLIKSKQNRMEVLVQTSDGWVHKNETGLYW